MDSRTFDLRALWGRLLCALGLHSWRWMTCADDCENRECRRDDCRVMQGRMIDCAGHPLERWTPFEPGREPWGPEW